MGIKFILGMAAAAIGGIYLTSDEGKKTREALQKKRSTFDPIIKGLLKNAADLLEGSEQVSQTEVRNNIRKLSLEAQKVLHQIDLEKTLDTIKEAIKVASRKITLAANDMPHKPVKIKKK